MTCWVGSSEPRVGDSKSARARRLCTTTGVLDDHGGPESGRQRRRKLPGTAGGGVRGSLHVCRMSRARDSSGRLLVWPVAAVATTRSRAAWWHLLLLQGGYRDAQRPKLTQTLLCCSLGVPWQLVVHVDCSGHPYSLLGACTCCGQGWCCVTANGAAGAAQCELFQCLCAQPPSRAGSPGGTYTMCESKIHTKVTRRVCCGLFWKYGRFMRIERFFTVDIDRSS